MVDTTGTPIVGASVCGRHTDASGRVLFAAEHPSDRVVEFDEVPAESLRPEASVRVAARGFAPTASPPFRWRRDGEPVRVVLHPERRITGRIVLPEPMSCRHWLVVAVATGSSPGNSIAHVTDVAADGTFELSGLATGRYDLGYKLPLLGCIGIKPRYVMPAVAADAVDVELPLAIDDRAEARRRSRG